MTAKKLLNNSRTHTNAAPISAPPTLPYAGHHRGKYHSLEQAAAASVSSSSTTPALAAAYASNPVSPVVPSGGTPPTNPYHQEGKTLYIKAIRALAAPVPPQQTYTFSTIIMNHSNVTLLSPTPMISAPIVSHRMLLLLRLIRANLLALPDFVPAVTTMITTVHDACKHTQLQG